MAWSLNVSNAVVDDDDEDDEPLLSGSGAVQKECTEEELGSWAELLNKWKDVTLRPRQLPGLVRKVIEPDYNTTDTVLDLRNKKCLATTLNDFEKDSPNSVWLETVLS